jgi:hypothetical protein
VCSFLPAYVPTLGVYLPLLFSPAVAVAAPLDVPVLPIPLLFHAVGVPVHLQRSS